MTDKAERSLASPSVARKLLEEAGIRPRRSMGQNFLIDANVLRIIEDAAQLDPSDTVIEVGSGLGSLTQLLANDCGRVLAVEADRRLFTVLEEELGELPNLTLVEADAARLDFADLFRGDVPLDGAKLVSNLPYNIAATVVIDCLQRHPWITVYVVMVQREVAERMLAAPGGKDYSAASVRVQCRARVKRVASVSRNSFFPRPKVDSTIIRLDRLDSADSPGGWPTDERFFEQLVTAAFSQRRKKLVNAVGSDASLGLPPEKVAAALITAGAGVAARAETLSSAQFVALSNLLVKHVERPR